MSWSVFKETITEDGYRSDYIYGDGETNNHKHEWYTPSQGTHAVDTTIHDDGSKTHVETEPTFIPKSEPQVSDKNTDIADSVNKTGSGK